MISSSINSSSNDSEGSLTIDHKETKLILNNVENIDFITVANYIFDNEDKYTFELPKNVQTKFTYIHVTYILYNQKNYLSEK